MAQKPDLKVLEAHATRFNICNVEDMQRFDSRPASF